jgi:deoxyribonuclease-4
MGTALGSRLEEVGEMLDALQSVGVAGCLDTAHLFAAGYDIKTASGLESTITQIDQTIGLENVPVIHVNDSKIPLGGRVDRHEHLGEGKIGAEGFTRILRHPRLSASPPAGLLGRAFLLETPIQDPGDDRRNVAKLWELAGLQDHAPEAEKGYSMLTAAAKKKMAAEYPKGVKKITKAKTKKPKKAARKSNKASKRG